MKKIQVTVTAEFEVPDTWEVIDLLQDNDNPKDKVTVLNMDGKYCNFTIDYLTENSIEEPQRWDSDEDFSNAMISLLETVDVEIIEI